MACDGFELLSSFDAVMASIMRFETCDLSPVACDLCLTDGAHDGFRIDMIGKYICQKFSFHRLSGVLLQMRKDTEDGDIKILPEYFRVRFCGNIFYSFGIIEYHPEYRNTH